MILRIFLPSRSRVSPNTFRKVSSTWASQQREIRLLRDTQRENIFKSEEQVAGRGRLSPLTPTRKALASELIETVSRGWCILEWWESDTKLEILPSFFGSRFRIILAWSQDVGTLRYLSNSDTGHTSKSSLPTLHISEIPNRYAFHCACWCGVTSHWTKTPSTRSHKISWHSKWTNNCCSVWIPP